MIVGKAEIVHIDIGTRQDDGNGLLAFRVFPVVKGYVDAFIRDALDRQFGIQDALPVDAHVSFHLVLSRGKCPDATHKSLTAKGFHFWSREIMWAPAQGRTHANLLAHDHIVAAHERVFGREDRDDIVIELNAQQHDEHAKKIGKEKADKLAYADMLTKQLPN